MKKNRNRKNPTRESGPSVLRLCTRRSTYIIQHCGICACGYAFSAAAGRAFSARYIVGWFSAQFRADGFQHFLLYPQNETSLGHQNSVSPLRKWPYTKVELFMEKGVRGRAQTAGANSRRSATKKREISRTLFSINLHFWTTVRTLSQKSEI